MTVAIHQIFYADTQRSLLDPAFTPYDNRLNPDPDWREYHVFRTEYRQDRVRDDAVTGYVSWKFGTKTRVRGSAFLDFIERHPDRDVYFISPPWIEPTRFRNIWLQGEDSHPGIIGLVREVFRRCGIDCDPEKMDQPESQVLYCNYWAGTRRFWDAYMAFCEPVRECLLHGLDEDDRRLLLSRADRSIDACYIPFIMERLFSTLLWLRGDISFQGWDEPYPARARRRWWRGWKRAA